MFAIPGTEKLIDLKQEDHKSATRLRAISPFTLASDERENHARMVKRRSRSISSEATRVKADGDSEMKRKKNALS